MDLYPQVLWAIASMGFRSASLPFHVDLGLDHNHRKYPIVSSPDLSTHLSIREFRWAFRVFRFLARFLARPSSLLYLRGDRGAVG